MFQKVNGNFYFLQNRTHIQKMIFHNICHRIQMGKKKQVQPSSNKSNAGRCGVGWREHTLLMITFKMFHLAKWEVLQYWTDQAHLKNLEDLSLLFELECFQIQLIHQAIVW